MIFFLTDKSSPGIPHIWLFDFKMAIFNLLTLTNPVIVPADEPSRHPRLFAAVLLTPTNPIVLPADCLVDTPGYSPQYITT